MAREFITFEEAAALLPDGDLIHTFVQPSAGLLLGADWDRDKLLALMRESLCELAGEAAASMGHGLVISDGDRTLFVKTNKERLEAIEAALAAAKEE